MRPLLYAMAFLGGTLLFLPVALLDFNVFDEGVIATGAMMVRDGDLPYRDFFSFYGPGQYYLAALLYHLFGEDLVVTRIAHAVTFAAIGAVVYAGARIATRNDRALVGWIMVAYFAFVVIAAPSAGYPALTALIPMMAGAMTFSRWATEGRRNALWTTSLLIGIAGLFRWDFGVFGVVVVVISVVAILIRRGGGIGRGLRLLAGAIVPAALLMALVYLPLLYLAGITQWVQEVIHYTLFGFTKWRDVEFLRPTVWMLATGLRHANVAEIYDALTRLLYAGLPFVVVTASCILLVQALYRDRKDIDRPAALVLFLSILCIFLLNQMRVRPDMAHGFPPFAAALPIAAYLIRVWIDELPAVRKIYPLVRVAQFALVAMIGTVAIGNYLAFFAGTPIDPLVPRTTWVRVPHSVKKEAALTQYGELVRYLAQSSTPEKPIFSGVEDTSRLLINDALIYFLADRPPTGRFMDMEAGVTNTARGQLEVVGDLQRDRVETIVLWDKISEERNDSAISNGVHILDDFTRANYEEQRQFGDYTVLARKARRPPHTMSEATSPSAVR